MCSIFKTGFIALLINLMVLFTTAFGTEVNVPLSPGAGVSGPGGTGFPVGKLATVVSYRHMETDGIRHKGSKVNDNVDLKKDFAVVKFRYGILEGFDVRTATPIYNVERKNNLTGASTDLGWIGDTSVVFHKVILNQKKGDSLFWAMDFGGILPTANSSSKNSDFAGNRAWGGFIGTEFTYLLGSNRFDQEFNFASFTEGDDNYRKPNRFRSNTTWSYAFNALFDAGIESNFEWNGESESYDASQDDSKMEWYAGPKIAFKYKPLKFNAALAVTFPVYRRYDANSPSDAYRIELKLIKVFF